MPCGDDFKVLLSRYVDGELSPDERLKVDEHIGSCEECRELLGLFRKNENLLAGALSTEAFGEAVIDSVVRKIGREAVPESEGVIGWFRARPWVQVAAAAVLLIGLVVTLEVSRSTQVAELRAQAKRADAQAKEAEERSAKLAEEFQGQMQYAGRLAEDLKNLRKDHETSEAIRNAGPGWMIGYVEGNHYLEVKASFDSKRFSAYNVLRRESTERDDRYVLLNTKSLEKPEYTDRTAKQGHTYVYKFQALGANLEMAESAPITMRLPVVGDLPPEKCVRIHCEDLAAPKDNGVFRLERLVEGRPVSHRFYVKLGDRLGDKVKVPGVGEVDFTTDLVLVKIEEATESRGVSVTAPVLDSDGQPVFEKVQDGAFVLATRSYERSLGSRLNRQAFLRPVGSANDSSKDQSLWRDSWMRVRAHGE
jgi:hypothetical protein